MSALQDIIKARNISMRQFGIRIKSDNANLCKIVNGRLGISPKFIKRIDSEFKLTKSEMTRLRIEALMFKLDSIKKKYKSTQSELYELLSLESK